MIIVLFILIVGGSYLYYRYYSVTDKKRFFDSPLFIAVTGSIGILAFSLIFVNTLDPNSPPDYQTQSDFLSVEEADTVYESLLAREPAFHFNLIRKVANEYRYIDHFLFLEETYHTFSRQQDEKVASVGNFCLGLIRMEKGKTAEARAYFGKVSDDMFPYLHFCKAEMFMKENKKSEAVAEYELELQNESGNRGPSLLALVEFYSARQDYEKLHDLMQYREAEDVFPESLARITLIHTGDFLNYPVWLLKMVVRKTNRVGFVAALLIAVMWMIYLFRLDIFKPEKFLSLLALFAGGMISVPVVFLFSDAIGLFTDWSLNDDFFNDLLYSIFMIGVPEEFAKALPLLAFVIFRGHLREPIDYVIYGCASALGFAFIENLLYFEGLGGGIIHGRAYLSVIGHMTDTSFIAYGFVITRYQLKDRRSLRYVLPLSFFAACITHGIYDLLLFHDLTFLFFIFFILMVQVWLIMINNCMNNSSHFTYAIASKSERSRIFITLALTVIFALEYITVAFTFGADHGNSEFLGNASFAGSLIIFFSSSLGSFDLIKGYWRNVKMNHTERRGYGSRQRLPPFISWYFLNASQSHNYVGQHITVTNDPYNKVLADILDRPYEGQIIDRITLFDEGVADPHWFLVKLTQPLPAAESPVDYLLVKLRYSEDSLRYEDEVEVHLRIVNELQSTKEARPDKADFPFCGWAYISTTNEVSPAVRRIAAEV